MPDVVWNLDVDWNLLAMPLAITIIGAGAAWLQHYAQRREDDRRRRDAAAKREAARSK